MTEVPDARGERHLDLARRRTDLFPPYDERACERFLARLAVLELLEGVETVHAFFGDRVDGGSGYEVLWKENVRWDDLKNLVQL